MTEIWLQASTVTASEFFPTSTIPGPVPSAVKVHTFTLPATFPTALGNPALGAGAGRAQFGLLTLSRSIDSSTPKLLLQTLRGEAFTSMTITAILPLGPAGVVGPKNRITYRFRNAVVVEWSNDDTLTEKLGVRFASLEVIVADAEGVQVGAEWDEVSNTGAEVMS